jgi:hypothetical protein
MSGIDDKNITIELTSDEVNALVLAMAGYTMHAKPSDESIALLRILMGIMTKIQKAIAVLKEGA